MMKMSGGVTSCCVALLLALTSVSAVQKLKSINGLKKINFGTSVPKHSLVLLHWFANTVEIDSDNDIWLNFDPNCEDYGLHHYRNDERMLNQLPRGYRYYTIGNLLEDTSEQLPAYVRNPPSEYAGDNRDRIIFRVQDRGWRGLHRVDQVYITQHYDTSEHQGSRYDPDHTYQITTNLLRQIREFSVEEEQQSLSYLRHRYGRNIDDFQVNDIRDEWGDLVCLGLLLFIVIEEKYSSNQRNNRSENDRRPEDNIRWENNSPEDTRLEINNGSEDNIRWEINNGSENTVCECPCNWLVICCIVLFILALIILLCIYFLKR
ncbi:uncharacterized protein LOC109139203 [Larimichthys crocea]|uniref:uncharacterized protein LOC109139203 n=1 Tax=Larimichthys crocea TaxID=215358 RepID=UPI000F5F74BE|nr:uncharacterized protein LOC109139203 [Larimichthys crocea]